MRAPSRARSRARSRRCRTTVQYLRLSNGKCGFDSRHRYSWQSVLGTTTAHSRPCDGSIPSAATFAGPPSLTGCSSGAERVAWADEAAGAIPATQTLPFLLDVAQELERAVGDREAAGAIPAIQTAATVPRMGHETTNLVGWGSIPLGGTTCLDVAQQQSAWVTTTMSLVQSQSSRQDRRAGITRLDRSFTARHRSMEGHDSAKVDG